MFKGASTPPFNPTLAPQSPVSVLLSWLSPDYNCSFSYAVRRNDGSFVTQYRTNTTSLTVTGLSVATMYHFAVAVEDASLATGPWSEVVNILWDGKYSLPTVVLSLLIHTVPQIVINISLVIKMDNLEVNWMVRL